MNELPTFDEVAKFHGHACPGLALGYRVAVAAMNRLHVKRAVDEDLVAVVENDACSVDAVQFICGCTVGKGNLIFRDHGKHVYTFFDRISGKNVRIYAEPPAGLRADPEAELASKADRTTAEEIVFTEWKRTYLKRLLAVDEGELLRMTEVSELPPPKARIYDVLRCDACGERVMEPLVTRAGCRKLCLPCQRAAG